MPLSAASAAAASSLSSFSRFFRHDNHLLWFAVIAVVGVTIYLVMSYNTTKTHEQTENALQRVRSSSGIAPHTDNEEDEENTGAVGDGGDGGDGIGDGDREGYSNAPQRDDHLSSTSSASSSTSPTSPSRRVRFKPPTAEDETTYSTDAPPSAVRPSSASSNATPSSVPLFVFLDIAKQDFLKSPFVGRLIIRLFPEHAPRTAHNFAQLCADKKYVNIPFHRVVKDFMIQGGDIVNQDGTGTYSVYGGEGSTFEDEGFALAHSEPGLLSMANSGPHTNGSQFFVLTQAAPHLDGKHVVFGKVVQGMEFVHDVEREVTDPNDRPIRKCYVLNCGVMEDTGVQAGTVGGGGQPQHHQQQHQQHQQQYQQQPQQQQQQWPSDQGGMQGTPSGPQPGAVGGIGYEPSPFSL